MYVWDDKDLDKCLLPPRLEHSRKLVAFKEILGVSINICPRFLVSIAKVNGLKIFVPGYGNMEVRIVRLNVGYVQVAGSSPLNV